MLSNILKHIEISQVYVLITFMYLVFNLKSNKPVHKILLLILLTSLTTEVLASVFLYFKQNVHIKLLYSVSVPIHNCLWFIVLKKIINNTSVIKLFIFGYILFFTCNFILIEGSKSFNHYTFIVGALLYISIFIYESFYQLKAENFKFFLSNEYILLSSPVIFFFGLSFIFGFKSEQLAQKTLLLNVRLYEFIMYFVNIIYYTLINIYIYREKKLKHVG